MKQYGSMGQRIKLCRERAGETLEQIGKLADVNKSTVLRWEQGQTIKISRPTLERLALHFGVSLRWLMGEDVPMDAARTQPAKKPPEMVLQLPVVSKMERDNEPAADDIIGYECADVHTLLPDEEYFWLRVSGDSMSPTMNNGDLVLVHKRSHVESGSYALVIVGEEEGTVKRITFGRHWIELHSINPYYPLRRFEGAATSQIQVVGQVVESRRKFTY